MLNVGNKSEYASEQVLKESIENIEYQITSKDKRKIIWKSSREIINKNVVILPKKIDYSNFCQGYIGDCYFISCVNALAQIPQLLHFIMGLTDKNIENENPLNFVVNYFIDGRWEKINVEDSFPCFENGELVGIKPKDNEVFMMIFEKSWAIINGGYDKIEGGKIENIFELFLGCKCTFKINEKDEIDSLFESVEKNEKDENNSLFEVEKKEKDEINSLFESIERNEKKFGTLSLCGSRYYTKQYDPKKNNIPIKDFDKKEAFKKDLIIHKPSDYHAYTIIKTKEISFGLTNGNTTKFFIISNPHGKNSDFIGSGIELKKIEEILEQSLGVENKTKYEFILRKNEKYNETGIIFMPLEYFIKWYKSISICSPHYSCISYTSNIKDELDCLYVYEVELFEQQSFTCQVCFQSFRAHRIDTNNYFYECEIKVIKKSDDFDVVKNYYPNNQKDFSSNEEIKDFSSIKEKNFLLEQGKYFIMIYPKSSINDAVIRFLSEKEINIKLINKINNNKSYQNFSILFQDNINNDYKKYLNPEENNNLSYEFIKEDFLPGIKDYYLHFEALSKSKGLSPEDAIYNISESGDAYYYDIIEPNSLKLVFQQIYKNKVYKDSVININTIQFIDNCGLPYKVKNFDELIREMKRNRDPLSCLFSEYDNNTNTLFSGIVHFKLYYNKATNEDILVFTDKQNNFLQRIQKPLFIIILDISGSMSKYHNYLQNNIIPKLLIKLGYYSKYKKLLNIIKEKHISSFEVLQAISSRIKFNHFINKYNLENIKLQHFKKFCEDIITLITFSNDSELYFYHVSDFESCYLSGGATYFKNAARNLRMILNSVSRERSIRLLSFSDGYIYDQEESMKILDEILNSGKTRHQMNSVSVQIRHETEPDTKILMKLSTFSHPITNMNQEIIEIDKETNEEEVINKLYQRFVNDDMNYYLKLFSDIDLMSNEFSNDFSKVQFLNNKNIAIRIKGHRSSSEYEKILKIYPGKLVIEDWGELNKNTFYNIMQENAPLISQKILERKVNQKGKSKVPLSTGGFSSS